MFLGHASQQSARYRLTPADRSERGRRRVGDGIEADRLQVDWGQRVEVAIAARALQLVA